MGILRHPLHRRRTLGLGLHARVHAEAHSRKGGELGNEQEEADALAHVTSLVSEPVRGQASHTYKAGYDS